MEHDIYILLLLLLLFFRRPFFNTYSLCLYTVFSLLSTLSAYLILKLLDATFITR